MNILITSAGGDSAIAAIRILKETTKHIIFAADCNQYASGLYLADEYFVVPRVNDDLYISKIVELVQKYKIDLIIPTIDEELLILCLNLGKIPCRVILSPLSTIVLCQDKFNLIQELKETVPVPEVYLSLESIKFPAIIKPKNSRGSKNVFLVQNKTEAKAVFEYLTSELYSTYELIFQEYLPGDEYTVDLVCDKESKPLVIVPRLRLVTKGGISTIGRTVKNKEIIKLVEKICLKIPFYGPVNIQFKKDKHGKIKLQEINPRLSGGLSITWLSGINLPILTLKVAFSEGISKWELIWKESFVYRYLQEGKV